MKFQRCFARGTRWFWKRKLHRKLGVLWYQSCPIRLSVGFISM